jgi:hypothetical protein
MYNVLFACFYSVSLLIYFCIFYCYIWLYMYVYSYFLSLSQPRGARVKSPLPSLRRLDVFNNMITVERIFIAILYWRVLLIFVNILKNPFTTYTTVRIV